MLPKNIALVDDDLEFSEFLAQHLRDQACGVRVFHDGGDLLSDHAAFGFDFYVLDLTLPGVDGLDLLRILRRRTQAGILVVTGRLTPDVFDRAITAGADMYLAKPVRLEQVALAVMAVQRRVAGAQESASTWRLDTGGSELTAPDGVRIGLSDNDRLVLECFIDAAGSPVSREELHRRLGHGEPDETDNLLHASIYRLRRRIERATPLPVPLQSVPRLGYVFRAQLVRA
ncbi:response regulator [Xylophilus sp. Kf1]|nr:response regulator [Xylophilus sp. Kf1]